MGDKNTERKDGGFDIGDLFDALKEAPAEIKKAFYEHGRQESVKNKKIHHRLGYALTRSNVVLGALMIGGILIGSMWVWGNILQPILLKVGILNRHIQNGYVQIPEKFEIFKGEKPTRDTISKLEIEMPVIKDGKISKEKRIVFADDKGHMYAKSQDLESFKVISMRSRFDWRLQPGLGFLIIPTADDEEDMADPALFVSPLEIYNKVSIDAFISPRRLGGGISGKLPFKWTKNTYIGGGVSAPYDDMTAKEFVIYGKINF